jgi:hypothetical protein
MVPRQPAKTKDSDEGMRAQPSRSKGRGTPSSKRRRVTLSQRVKKELGVSSAVVGFVGTILGLLYLPRLVNVAAIIGTILVAFLVQRRDSILLFKDLRSQGKVRAYLLVPGVAVLICVVAGVSFYVGNKLGQTSAARNILKSLDLPARPIPPPRPRFPGDVNLDEYCRSQGPYQVASPTDTGFYVQFKTGPPYFVPSIIPKDQLKKIAADLGPNFLACQSRIRQPTTSTGESDTIYFRVDDGCAWQYPGQRVRAVPPKDRHYIDQWRCQLVSGPPATWPR